MHSQEELSSAHARAEISCLIGSVKRNKKLTSIHPYVGPDAAICQHQDLQAQWHSSSRESKLHGPWKRDNANWKPQSSKGWGKLISWLSSVRKWKYLAQMRLKGNRKSVWIQSLWCSAGPEAYFQESANGFYCFFPSRAVTSNYPRVLSILSFIS